MNSVRSKSKVRKGSKWFFCLVIQSVIYIAFALVIPTAISQSQDFESILSSKGFILGGVTTSGSQVDLVLGRSKDQNHQNIVNNNEVTQKIAKLHMPFITNQGQTDERVEFYAHTFGGIVFVTNTGEIVYSLPKVEDKKSAPHPNPFDKAQDRLPPQRGEGDLARNTKISRGLALKEEIVGGKVKEVKGEGKAITKVSYFKGNDPSKWKRNIPTYDLVSLGEVYKGVELKLKAYGKNVEKLFYIKPGAEPGRIRVKLSGGKLNVNKDGELEVRTELGTVKFTKPVVYQEDGSTGLTTGGGNKKFVKVAYVVNGDEYSFRVGDYDRTKELIIDPLLASTFLGGSGGDSALSITISGGNVYVAGLTNSSPQIFQTPSRPFSGSQDVFVAKLNGNLTALLASTFLGGTRGFVEEVNSIVISGKDVYVTGTTISPDFPTTDGALDRTCGTDGNCNPITLEDRQILLSDAFVSRLDGNLMLLASTFLGGKDEDFGNSIAISGENVYVTGRTQSSDFRTVYNITRPDAVDPDCGTDGKCNPRDTRMGLLVRPIGHDAFVSMLNGNLTELIASTFLGGSDFDEANSIAISGGNVYVTGRTNSPEIFQTQTPSRPFSGFFDAFVARLDGNLTSFLASTFLGGKRFPFCPTCTPAGFDRANSIIISGGNVYVTGRTNSPKFPTPNGEDQMCGTDPDGTCNADEFQNFHDAFVSMLDENLVLQNSTFLGGSEFDEANSIAISSGNVYVTGHTASSDFPTRPPGGAFDNTFDGPPGRFRGDAFVSRFSANLGTLDASTFLGGRDVLGNFFSGSDEANSIAIDPCENVYVIGRTDSPDFPVTPRPGAFDTSCGTDGNCNGGIGDAFISKFAPNLSAGTAASADLSVAVNENPPQSDPITLGNNVTYTVTVNNNGPLTATCVILTNTLPSGVNFVDAVPARPQDSCSQSGGTVTCILRNLAIGPTTVNIVVRPTAVGVISNTVSVTGSETDSNPINDMKTEMTTVNPPLPGPANLAVTKEALPNPAIFDEDLRYTVRIKNNGPNMATGVRLTDTLDSGVTFRGVLPGPPMCNRLGNMVNCSLPNLASGADAPVVTIVVRPNVAGTMTNVKTITNMVNVTGNEPGTNKAIMLDTRVIAMCDGRPATIVGTPGNDPNLTGTGVADVIHGLGGDDTIGGLDGNDIICGGDGKDKLTGNARDDRLFGGNNDDVLDGKADNDFCDGGPPDPPVLPGDIADPIGCETRVGIETEMDLP